MPTSDISLDTPFVATPHERSLQIANALRLSLLIVVIAMVWAVPLSAMLAVNLFRIAVILWLVNAWDRRQALARSRIFLPLLCFLATTAIASLAAQDRVASWQQMKVMELGCATVIVADVLCGLRNLTSTVTGLLVTGCIAAGIAVWQVSSGAMVRAEGLSRHYIDFGEMMLLLALLGFGIFIASLRDARPLFRWALGVVFTLLTTAIAATATRTFLAALILGCTLIIWMRFGWRVRALAVGLTIVAVVVGGLWLHSRRGMTWFDRADPGTQYRLLIWKDGARIIRAHPLLGIGFANAQRHPERYHMSAYHAYPNMISHFHSTPIELAAGCGLPALAVWCWLMFACWSTARHAVKQSNHAIWFERGVAFGVLGAFVGLQLASLVHYIAGDPEPMLIFWSLVAFAIILEMQGGRRNQEKEVP